MLQNQSQLTECPSIGEFALAWLHRFAVDAWVGIQRQRRRITHLSRYRNVDNAVVVVNEEDVFGFEVGVN